MGRNRDAKGGVSKRRGGRRAGRVLMMVSSSVFVASMAASATAPTERRSPSTASADTITRLAFGSCNKQHLPQPMWSAIEELSPDVWLWIGDAVYVDKHSDGGVDKMKEALGDQLANKDYQRFLSKVSRVDGVWDDHDFGVNDAGKELVDHPGRVDAFLDFLGAGPEDPRRGGATLYSSHVFGEAPRKVKVLLLDVRTARDKYHLFNISGKRFKFAAMLGAMLRLLSSSLCLGSDYDGEVIGDDQFRWLEDELTDSDASVHVLVSTLQMLTSNPLVESWGHFPKSRDRMLSLLWRTNPAGLVILTGDVHHAELSSGWKKSSSFSAAPPMWASKPSSTPADSTEGDGGADPGVMPPGHEAMVRAGKVEGGGGCPFAKLGRTGPVAVNSGNGGCAAALAGGTSGDRKGRGVVEVTSSGMTHSCLSSHGKTLCEAYLKTWPEHRWRDDAYYLDSNFGYIELVWAEGEGVAQPEKMTVTVRDTHGTPILPVVEFFGDEHRHREAAERATATETEDYEDEHGKRRPGAERTFLERPPPPECVEPVLPEGCTAQRLSVVAFTLAALVVSCVGVCSGARRRNSVRTHAAAKNVRGTGNGSGNGSGNGATSHPGGSLSVEETGRGAG